MEKHIVKLLFIGGIVYYFVSVYLNIEFTLHMNSTQYVPEGEQSDPVRAAEIVGDIIRPAKDALILIGLSYVIKLLSKDR